MHKIIFVVVYIISFAGTADSQNKTVSAETLQYPDEKHFKNLRQLTFGGDNAEAYFSNDGTYLTFQKTNPKEGIACDQIWMGKVPESADEPFVPKLVSTGTGRTTCAYFYPDGKHILYASTHLDSKDCPAVPDKAKRYIWPVYASFDLFKADTSGRIIKR